MYFSRHRPPNFHFFGSFITSRHLLLLAMVLPPSFVSPASADPIFIGRYINMPGKACSAFRGFLLDRLQPFMDKSCSSIIEADPISALNHIHGLIHSIVCVLSFFVFCFLLYILTFSL